MTQEELENKLFCYRAKFVRAIDGDTYEVVIDHGMKIQSVQHVRLNGINCPEIFAASKDTEEYKKGIAAKDRVELLLLPSSQNGHDYLFIKTYKDKMTFNRYVADVYFKLGSVWTSLADTLVGEELGVRI